MKGRANQVKVHDSHPEAPKLRKNSLLVCFVTDVCPHFNVSGAHSNSVTVQLAKAIFVLYQARSFSSQPHTRCSTGSRHSHTVRRAKSECRVDSVTKYTKKSYARSGYVLKRNSFLGYCHSINKTLAFWRSKRSSRARAYSKYPNSICDEAFRTPQSAHM